MIAALLAGLAVLSIGWSWSPAARDRVRSDPADLDAAVDESFVATGAAPAPQPRRTPTRVDPIELAVWCDGLARAVRGGATLRQAVLDVAPPAAVAGHIDGVRLQLERGAPLRAALEPRPPVPVHLDLVLVVLRACAVHGGPPSEPIDRAAAALRQRAAVIAERRSQSAQAHMSAVVMTLLPGVLLGVLLLTSASVRSALTTPAGLAVVALGAATNLIGWWWMRRLIHGRSAWG
jgi:Flp pilus assembly protein TadB